MSERRRGHRIRVAKRTYGNGMTVYQGICSCGLYRSRWHPDESVARASGEAHSKSKDDERVKV